MILLYIVCNMQNMQINMHDMQNMSNSISICRICTSNFADDWTFATKRSTFHNMKRRQHQPWHCRAWGSRVTSANRVTIISDYFYFHRLYAIIYDYSRLFTIILLQKPKWLYAIIALSPKRRLFHFLHYDDFTYFFRHILLRS